MNETRKTIVGDPEALLRDLESREFDPDDWAGDTFERYRRNRAEAERLDLESAQRLSGWDLAEEIAAAIRNAKASQPTKESNQ